jgi:hypothetical protein
VKEEIGLLESILLRLLLATLVNWVLLMNIQQLNSKLGISKVDLNFPINEISRVDERGTRILNLKEKINLQF